MLRKQKINNPTLVYGLEFIFILYYEEVKVRPSCALPSH